MKKIIILTITTLLLLLNCSNNAPNEPPIPCKDGLCLTDGQLNFFKMHLEDDTLTKKVLFEMSSMDLSSKDITSLDTGIFNNLINLTSVDLTDNPICSVDKGDVGLADTVTVNLTIDARCITNEQLNFFKMHLEDDTLTKKVLFEMSSMDLSSKGISTLPTGIFTKLTNLTILSLYNNQLTNIPTDIGNLTSLTELYLGSNQLASIPAEIGNLTSLTRLDLNNNDLTNIPAEIGNLTSLTELYLWGNKLTSIPTEIGNLTSLTILDLYSNQLASFPDGIFTGLTNLTRLQLKVGAGFIEMNSFGCERGDYTRWGLPDPITMITQFICN